MLWFGAFATFFTVPLLLSAENVSSPFLAFVLIIVALAIVSFYTSISGLIKAEMFPPEVRALASVCLTRWRMRSSAARRNTSRCA